MSKKKKIILVVLAVIIVGICSGVIFFNNSQNKLDQLVDLPISNVDLSNIKDGTYPGSYKAFPIVVEVKVAIKDHKIAEIELVKHQNGQGAAAEVIPKKVLEAQSLEIDAVTGATYSSKVILKAIENALNSAQK